MSEAQVLASLNHPHIGAIYGFEDSGVHLYFVYFARLRIPSASI